MVGGLFKHFLKHGEDFINELFYLLPDRCIVRFKPGRELKDRVAKLPVEEVLAKKSHNGAYGPGVVP